MGASIQISDDAEAMAQTVRRRLVALGGEAVAARGCFRLALAGGSTPRILYRRLAEPEPGANLDWRRVEVFFSDERDVPPDHPDSNYRMARETLLDHVPIPPAQVHPMRTATCSLRRDSARYGAALRRLLPSAGGGWPRFDLALLGLGTDGHTASLFPGTCVLHERTLSVAAVYVPQLQQWRMSLTLPVLEHARHLWFLVSGAAKAETLAAALAQAGRGTRLPVQLLQPRGHVEWFCDRAAASALSVADAAP